LTGRRDRLRSLARRALLPAAAILAVCGGVWAVRARPPASPLAGPRAPLRAYELGWRTRAGIRAGPADGAQGWTLEGRGRLVLKRYGDGAVAARLEGAHLTVAEAEVIYPGVERPFSFREDARGYLSGFAFAPGLPEETRSLLRQAVSLLQVVSPERARDRWQVRERDALGIFRATYERVDAAGLRLQKRKLEYLPQPPGGGEAAIARQVIGSETALELGAGSGDLARAQGREVLHARGPGGLALEEATEFTVERADGADPFPAAFAELEAERDRPWEPDALAAPAAAPEPEAPGSLEEALRAFAARRGRDLAAAEAAVTAWLRAHPGAPRALVAYLDACSRGERKELDAAAQAALFRLLAGAGTPESLEALLDAATNAGHDARTRKLAVAHMDQVPVARVEQVDALLALSERERAVPGGGDLARRALLVTGALGHREVGPPEVSARVVEALQARLAAAPDAASRRTAVLAMGNCGDPRLAGSLERALADADPDVRATAAHAFRRLDAAEAVPRLLARYHEERAPEVRAALVRTLGRHAGRDDVLTWARAELLAARDAPSLLALVALVELVGSTAARSPASAAALRELLARRPGREVERAVLRFVAPRG
jgi:HEAT repeat protein